jgi:hypothetical protein
MREKLNSNPLFQLAVVGVLLLFGGIFLLTTMGGGGAEEGESGESSLSAAASSEEAAPSPTAPSPSATASASVPGEPGLATRPLPRSVRSPWRAGQTVVLIFVHDDGIDDALVKQASGRLEGMSGVTTIVVSSGELARYAAITEGVGVDRLPALVALEPRRAGQEVPVASVSYGFQSGESIEQAVIDAGYKGPTIDYHP